MKKRKLVALVIAVLMTMLIPATAFAATHEDVDSWDKLQAAFADTDADVTIILTGDIATLGALQAGEGQTYVINGEEYILKDVRLVGAGEVEINAEVQRDSQAQALHVTDDVQVTVNGDVKSEGSLGGGVMAEGNSKASINGTVDGGDMGVVAKESAAVEVQGDVSGGMAGAVSTGESSVKINGDVSANGAGVGAAESGNVEVTGNVTGGQVGIITEDDASVKVTGDVQASDVLDGTADQNGAGLGVDARGNSTVVVDGNVSGGNGNESTANMTAPDGYSDGGTGVNAQANANVNVTGNVTGGDAAGTFAYAGDGVVAEGQSTVTVGGDVKGGDVKADPEVEAEGDDLSRGGNGVVMAPKANVTVGGDVKGGDTSGDKGVAGQGAIVLTLDKTNPDNTDAKAGKLTIMGTVKGGSALAQSGKDGNAIHLDDPFDTVPEEYQTQAEDLYILEIPDGTVREFLNGLLNAKMSFLYGYVGQDMSIDEVIAEVETFKNEKIMPLLANVLGHEYDIDNDSETLDNLDAVQAAALKKAIADEFNKFARQRWISWADSVLLKPEVTVWKLEGGDDAGYFGSPGGEFIASLIGADTNYIVKIAQSEGGMLVSDKETAKAGETVTVTALPKAGYTLGKVLLNGEELTGKDGVYSFVMPEGGGVELSAEFIADAPAEAPTNTAGSPKTGDNFSAALLMGLMAVSAMAVVVVGRKARTGK
ncbi:hypothetical protein H8699_07015 [Christensenellaceae bacterium NSJ-44]|uniref:Bacterial repeat domain-containing protein n=1 Tax=Luoshenia tenuis TaxID=2763654 RepID=A0A926HN13_9FIRM|nr:hypothetical protein [Luoshenia tenuis]MBC8529175.1 hypothetical protein [Luoshenia tenuis]